MGARGRMRDICLAKRWWVEREALTQHTCVLRYTRTHAHTHPPPTPSAAFLENNSATCWLFTRIVSSKP